MRRKTRVIHVGSVKIGGGNPISVQSMTNTDTCDADATLGQIKKLEAAGCEIVRVSVPSDDAVKSLRSIRDKINMSVIADIHFDYRLALKSIDIGVDGLRINPGNIGNRERVKAIVESAGKRAIPIRIGVNSGSLEKELLHKYGAVTPEGMVESCVRHIRMLEEMGFYEIKISIKASDVGETVKSYRLMAKEVDYPFHLGITEAGTLFSGTIKSAVGLGILLNEGIGDTIRVSLSADPVEEVRVGFEILKSLGLRKRGVNIISCPTCSRQEIDVTVLAKELENRLMNIETPLDLAVMGCAVNGPGEAKRCDVGVAGGKGVGVIFKDGKVKRKVKKDSLFKEVMNEINEFLKEEKKDEIF